MKKFVAIPTALQDLIQSLEEGITAGSNIQAIILGYIEQTDYLCAQTTIYYEQAKSEKDEKLARFYEGQLEESNKKLSFLREDYAKRAGELALFEGQLTEARAEMANYGEIEMGDEEETAHLQSLSSIADEQASLTALEALKDIDVKSIRALRTGDAQRLIELEAEAVELRKQIKKD